LLSDSLPFVPSNNAHYLRLQRVRYAVKDAEGVHLSRGVAGLLGNLVGIKLETGAILAPATEGMFARVPERRS